MKRNVKNEVIEVAVQILNAASYDDVVDYFCENAQCKDLAEVFETLAECLLTNISPKSASRVLTDFFDVVDIEENKELFPEAYEQFKVQMDTDVLKAELYERGALVDVEGDKENALGALLRSEGVEGVQAMIDAWRKLNEVGCN